MDRCSRNVGNRNSPIPPLMKIVVGLSGGVDSTVAAKLLVEQGHEVVGVFMRNWEEGGPECTATEDALEAEKVAQKLGIEFHMVNFSKEYWEHVFEYFLKENEAGRTPNPDILCNKFVKFDSFLKEAKKLGADKIAMGHYADISKKGDLFQLEIPADKEKDQTYFLHALNQKQLSQSIFPLAEMRKDEVRDLAREAGFLNAEKKDSTGICFIGERNYSEFLQKYVKKIPGKIRDYGTKKIIGDHIGLSFYTIGQRKELGIGGVKGFEEAPWFVIKKDLKNNELIVSQNESLLDAVILEAKNFNWIAGIPPGGKFEALGKIRYRDKGEMCDVKIKNCKDAINHVCIKFHNPVRAITAGQSIVLYDNDVCLGGGEII
jgi:tRNA-uridine 2-sulfurtransferase